jgi:hypothetical protein
MFFLRKSQLGATLSRFSQVLRDVAEAQDLLKCSFEVAFVQPLKQFIKVP